VRPVTGRLLCAYAVGFFAVLLHDSFRAVAAESPPALLSETIPAQPLGGALRDLARLTHLQIVYVAAVARHRDSGGAPGGIPIRDALSRVLEGTGLQFEFLNERTVKIFSPSATPVWSRHTTRPNVQYPMSEVVVTANRREEIEQRVPISLVAWTRADLDAVGAKEFRDIAARTPGVEYDFYPDLGPGTHTNVAIRGVDARDGTATAVYLDDVPLRPDPAGSVGRAFPLLTDLDRVEILRGPQSTLLGEGAEGGVVRFVTTTPSLTATTGYVRSEVTTTEHGGAGFHTAGAFGAPLVENRIGFRASAGYETDGGFVDRVDPFSLAVVDRNVNRTTARSARLGLLWAPADAVRITPTFTYQQRYSHDSPVFYEALSNPPNAVLRSGKLLRQPTDDGFSIASVNATAEFPGLELTSLTSHFHRSVYSVTDATNNGIGWGNPLGPEYPASDQTFLDTFIVVRQSEWVQELRLTTTDPNARLTWLLGASLLYASYSDENSTAPALNQNGVQIGDSDLVSHGHERQTAAFGELTWRLSDRLAARAGARLTHASYESVVPAAAGAPGSAGYVTLSGRESPASPRIMLSYQARPEVLYYATVSTGYRLGGINPPIQPWCPVPFPAAYGPDRVVNYELGSKSRLFDGRVRLEASAFHMSWRHLQTDLNELHPACFTYIVNVGTAASDGFDVAADAIFADAVRLGLAVAYTHARYTETILNGNAIRARAGDSVGSIPVVPSPWNVTAYAEYGVRLSDRCRAFLASEDIFHTRNPGPFYSLDPASPNYDPGKRPDPSNNLLNLRAGLRWPSLELQLFVDNALDSQPTLLRRNVYVGSTLFVATTVRPRTVGTSLRWQY
jgi:iron complex outermembrane receptor protein